jgi:hypothetical protein
MHEHTSHRTRWIWRLPWNWDTYTSPSGKFVMQWRGPLVRSKMTFWEHDHPPGQEVEGCGASFIIGGVK